MSTIHTIRAHAQEFEINWTKIKGGCQSGRKVVTHSSKSNLPLNVLLIMAQFLGKARCYSCNGTLCLQPTQDQIVECNFKQNTCQFSMSGFTPESFSVERSCGPSNTSLHQCIGLRKDSSLSDWPKDEKG